ncbi:high frequency lysogenization protein [Glaciecola punicea ACAM 611]|jgi:high frequency lysogenization protein|uniref:High frequency lysogenization protein HflD homolog n=1 Tax=Glaciecola punicea ACAM 611 TaxID=1121923 RepID=H5T8Y8_9ALTE|nr:high frequency lysogenization protein HflD [Glaciecola punicea]OFA31655.1 lysogenization protein HflD [Glaciecola punicea]GAB54765.1 high frequency lysogenization protein [Glaciecola punicea ACAM 611]
MTTQFEEQQLALAGVCQSASLVQSIARKGEADKSAVEASLSSILVTSPDNTQQVFGALPNLRLGFTTLVKQIDSNNKLKDAELTRYIASILSLERKLSRQTKAMDDLSQRVSHVQRQLDHVDFENYQIITNLASIYTDVVSSLAPKIQIAGNPQYLSVENNQKKIRALLLAGVRAAVLWRQLGGKRRHILLNRKALLESAQSAVRAM